MIPTACSCSTMIGKRRSKPRSKRPAWRPPLIPNRPSWRICPPTARIYTVVLRGAGDSTGIGVVEAYDLDVSVNSQLANISTRALVQTGDDILIAGTIIVGNAPQKVLVRAIGPSLPLPEPYPIQPWNCGTGTAPDRSQRQLEKRPGSGDCGDNDSADELF